MFGSSIPAERRRETRRDSCRRFSLSLPQVLQDEITAEIDIRLLQQHLSVSGTQTERVAEHIAQHSEWQFGELLSNVVDEVS